MNTATAEWTSGGIKIGVTTVKLDGESNDTWAARHKASVTSMLEQFPKDG